MNSYKIAGERFQMIDACCMDLLNILSLATNLKRSDDRFKIAAKNGGALNARSTRL